MATKKTYTSARKSASVDDVKKAGSDTESANPKSSGKHAETPPTMEELSRAVSALSRGTLSFQEEVNKFHKEINKFHKEMTTIASSHEKRIGDLEVKVGKMEKVFWGVSPEEDADSNSDEETSKENTGSNKKTPEEDVEPPIGGAHIEEWYTFRQPDGKYSKTRLRSIFAAKQASHDILPKYVWVGEDAYIRDLNPTEIEEYNPQ